MGATPIRARFAPSPTGALHVGSMRTALFAWLAARAGGGRFILRIEDTDQGRYVPGSESQILESLRWLGLWWDEGPEVGGPHSPYVQSLRVDSYRDVGERLAASGSAYWCTCTPGRLAELRAHQRTLSLPPRYDRHCVERQAEVTAARRAGAPAVLRQLMPEGPIEWDDAVRGIITFESRDIDDSVLIKSDGFPTYHLAVVADDHAMEISHVIRSEEWIPSTPKHLMLYRALNWTPPTFAHVPAVLGEDRQKLSKRRGARNVLQYREAGYLPQALINAMVLLGWSSGTEEEIFTPDQLCRQFSLERVHPAPAVFDAKRLDTLNGIHIRRLEPDALANALAPWLPGTSASQRNRIVPLVHERLTRLADVTSLAQPLLGDAPWQPGVEFPPRKVDPTTAATLLDAAITQLEPGDPIDPDQLRQNLTRMLEDSGTKPRDGFRVLYVAILGGPTGVPVFDAMVYIGAERSIQRLRSARAALGQNASI